MPKEISRGTYLKALGLFTLAKHHIGRGDELAEALERMLGVPDDDLRCSHFCDELYSYGERSLDAALQRAEYTVVDEPPDVLIAGARTMAAALDGSDEAKTDPIFTDAAGTIRELVKALETKERKLT